MASPAVGGEGIGHLFFSQCCLILCSRKALTQPQHPPPPSTTPPASLVHDNSPPAPISWCPLQLGHWPHRAGTWGPSLGSCTGSAVACPEEDGRAGMVPQGEHGWPGEQGYSPRENRDAPQPGAECRRESAPASPRRCTRKAGKGPPVKGEEQSTGSKRGQPCPRPGPGDLAQQCPGQWLSPPAEAHGSCLSTKASRAEN